MFSSGIMFYIYILGEWLFELYEMLLRLITRNNSRFLRESGHN